VTWNSTLQQCQICRYDLTAAHFRKDDTRNGHRNGYENQISSIVLHSDNHCESCLRVTGLYEPLGEGYLRGEAYLDDNS